VSASNAAAVALVDRWPDWPLASALVTGPRGAGKSHLAHVWRLRSGADIVRADSINEATIEGLKASRALAIEDIDQGIAHEPVLFHLLNLAREHGFHLLLTSAKAAGELDVSLPDLRSRLRALPMVGIEMPDEPLLKAVLVKLFSDRQLMVEPHVIDYVALHIERSMAAAQDVVHEIDRRALALHRKVTRVLATETLAYLRGDGGEP